ncbi:hypothetical protein ACFYP4_21230 [Streptomyces sp. NPDC005551]
MTGQPRFSLAATVLDADDVRVLFDPAGHPFCLFVRAAASR